MSSSPVVSFVPAALWRRLAAIVYDSFLVFAIWIIIGFIVLSAFGITEARTIEGNAVVLEPLYKNTLFAAMMISAYLFFGWFWTHSGQTLGMQAWRIKMQNADGSAINWLQTLQRCFAVHGCPRACGNRLLLDVD